MKTIIVEFENSPKDDLFEKSLSMMDLIDKHNEIIQELDEEKRKHCTINYTDSPKTMRKKCKNARKTGYFHIPLYMTLFPNSTTPSANTSNTDATTTDGSDTSSSGMATEDIILDAEDSSTERVRRYYKRHPKKVTQYLRKTAKDRAARNRDRKKAVKKYGKNKMKNHDVHHPNGPHNGNWKLAKKDHGRDTKDMQKRKAKALAKPAPIQKPTPKPAEKPIEKKLTFTAHTFKNLGLSFDDVIKILGRSLGELLGMATKISDKLQNDTIKVTISNGKLLVVKNKSDVNDPEKAGVSSKNFIDSYDGDVHLKTAIAQTLVDLEKMIRMDGNIDAMKKVFNNGKKFVSLDIFAGKENNVTPGDKNFVVFKDVVSYDEDYKETTTTENASKFLLSNLLKYQYTLEPNKVNNTFFSEEQTYKLEAQIKKIADSMQSVAREYNLSIEDNLRDYLVQVCNELLMKLEQENDIDFTEEERKDILYRWVDGEEFDLDKLDESRSKIIKTYEKQMLKPDIIDGMSNIQSVILKGSIFLLQRINNTLVGSIPHKKKIINTEISKSIDMVNNAYIEGKDVYDTLQKELKRLRSVEIETDEVVFYYDGEFYIFSKNSPLIVGMETLTSFDDTESRKPINKTRKGTGKNKNRLKGILTNLFKQKIKLTNPKTGEPILLRTALGYGPGHPAYDAAREWLKNNVKGIPLFRDPSVAILHKRPKTKGYNKYGYYE